MMVGTELQVLRMVEMLGVVQISVICLRNQRRAGLNAHVVIEVKLAWRRMITIGVELRVMPGATMLGVEQIWVKCLKDKTRAGLTAPAVTEARTRSQKAVPLLLLMTYQGLTHGESHRKAEVMDHERVARNGAARDVKDQGEIAMHSPWKRYLKTALR
jgi:hypothetical protein